MNCSEVFYYLCNLIAESVGVFNRYYYTVLAKSLEPLLNGEKLALTFVKVLFQI